MLRTRQILQMLSNGVPQKQICADVHCSKRLVSALKKKVEDTGKSYWEMLNLPDSEFSTIFLGNVEASSTDPRKEELDRMMPEIIKRLSRKHAHVQFVFEDYYQKECPDGYGYTQFKKHVSAYREKNDYSYHNEHEPGREWQIDFAGDALYLTDPKTGAKQKLVVLVCVMPYSNLPFMMAMPKATTEWFFHGLNKGLEFMGVLPHVAKSDNMKQWVTKSGRYSLTFSEANVEWALYYGIEPTACRVRKPRDKGPVEGAVNQLYQYVYARLEGEVFYTLDALNDRIMELLDEYCSRPYKGSTRWEIFEKYEKPEMRPLPGAMYRFRMRKEVKLGATYHVCVGSERHFYSVPYKYVGQIVKVMWDVQYVEVYVNDELVCVHNRSFVPYGYTTEKAHMPEQHLAYEHRKEVNAAKLLEWGANIGPSVRLVIEDILRRTTFPQQAYGKCSGVLGLAKKYGKARLEHACAKLMEAGTAASYKSPCNMLKNNRDLERDGNGTVSRTPFNDNVRGAAAYKSVLNSRKEVKDGE